MRSNANHSEGKPPLPGDDSHVDLSGLFRRTAPTNRPVDAESLRTAALVRSSVGRLWRRHAIAAGLLVSALVVASLGLG